MVFYRKYFAEPKRKFIFEPNYKSIRGLPDTKSDKMTTTIYNGLKFSTTQINSNFKIKVNGINFEGKKLNTLVGVSGLIKLIGIELVNTLLTRAFDCPLDKCVCKLRRGLKITFYSI